MPRDYQPVHAIDPIELVHQEIQRTQPDLAELTRVAEGLRADPVSLRTSLRGLLESRAQLEEVADRSYLHPNGFAKVMLQMGGGYRIRLHVWRQGDRKYGFDANPHGHRWDFASWVVVGALRETTFSETPGHRQYERSSYRRRANGASFMEATGDAGLEPLHDTIREAGTVYARSRSELHSVVPVGTDVVASLVLQRPPSGEFAAVFLRHGKPADYKERPLTVGELEAVIAEVTAARW